jgi:hypothetical protein
LASAEVPRHERVTLHPVRGKNASGQSELVGFKIKLTLHTIDSQRFPKAHVALVDPAKTNQLTRGQAVDPKKGMLRHQFDAVDGIQVGQPREIEWSVKYADTDLKPGEPVDVVSAWPVEGTRYEDANVHVFGAVTVKKNGAGDFKLPHQGDSQ